MAGPVHVMRAPELVELLYILARHQRTVFSLGPGECNTTISTMSRGLICIIKEV